LVGAGLDSFILRQAQQYPNLKIFEVDHPDTQAAKQRKLQRFGEIPKMLNLWQLILKKSRLQMHYQEAFQQDKPAFFHG
jgi:O-methyltransferase involved in polyketide biosynthesis